MLCWNGMLNLKWDTEIRGRYWSSGSTGRGRPICFLSVFVWHKPWKPQPEYSICQPPLTVAKWYKVIVCRMLTDIVVNSYWSLRFSFHLWFIFLWKQEKKDRVVSVWSDVYRTLGNQFGLVWTGWKRNGGTDRKGWLSVCARVCRVRAKHRTLLFLETGCHYCCLCWCHGVRIRNGASLCWRC